MKLKFLLVPGLCVLAVCAITDNVSAQQQPKSIVPVLVQAQRGNWMMRLVDADTRSTQGRIVNVSDTLVYVGTNSRLNVSDVRYMMRGTRDGNSAKGGAIGGAVIGSALGALAGSSFCAEDETRHGGSCAGPTIGGAVLVAGVGAIFGLLIGEAFNPAKLDWKQVWP